MNECIIYRKAITKMQAAVIAIIIILAIIVGATYYYSLMGPAVTPTPLTPTPFTPTPLTPTPFTPTPLTPTPSEREVRIGSLVSLTGVLAAFGQPSGWAIEKFIEDINSLGGIMVGGRKIPVKLIMYDDSSDASKASALAEQLILQDKVHVLLVPPGPPTISIPVNHVAERYKVPCASDGTFEAWWGAGPWQYCWLLSGPVMTTRIIPEGDPRFGKPGYYILDNYIHVANLFAEKINKRVGIFAPADADGTTFYSLISKILQDAGYTVVGVDKKLGLYAVGTMDYTAIIREWKDGEAEVLMGLSRGPDFTVMWKQALSLGWKPKLATDGRAVKNYEDVAAMGPDLAVGMIDPFQSVHPSAPHKTLLTGKTMKDLTREYEKETGRPYSQMLASYGWAEALCKAIEIADSLDPEKINQAFPKLEMFSWGRWVKIVPEYHASPSIYCAVQWMMVNQTLFPEIIWTPDTSFAPVTHAPIFPLP